MITKEAILQQLTKMSTKSNEEEINNLISQVQNMNEDELMNVLKHKKIVTIGDLKRFVKDRTKTIKTKASKFIELNELVSYGVAGKTIHIHVVPKDVRNLLTREGMKQAELALIDAAEKIKQLIQKDKRYYKIENVYAVSGIISGPVARWFKNIGFDVKTLPINEAKTDEELKNFYKRFKNQNKLGRAVLSKEKLLSDEWEQIKDERKKSLGISVKSNDFVDSLKDLNATEQEVVESLNNFGDEQIKKEPKKRIEEI